MNRMREFRRQLRASIGRVLAFQIRDGHGAAISGVLERVIRGERVHDEEIAEVMAYDGDGDGEDAARRVMTTAGPIVIPGASGGKGVALVPARGVALYDLDYQPFCFSTLLLAQTVTALANDPEIGTIIIDMDTPGGSVTGTKEAGDAVYAARQTKKVVVIVNPLCASAGYWIASQATQIVAVPSADIGSVGVFMLHADCSGFMQQMGVKPTFIFAGEFKTEGNPYEPLAESARDYFQGEVDETYGDFLATVARGRGKTVDEVKENFGKGRTLSAPNAKRVGMIDAIATLSDALARFGVSSRTMEGRRRVELAGPTETAGDPNAAGEDPAPIDDAAGPAHQPEAEACGEAIAPSPAGASLAASPDPDEFRRRRHAHRLRSQ